MMIIGEKQPYYPRLMCLLSLNTESLLDSLSTCFNEDDMLLSNLNHQIILDILAEIMTDKNHQSRFEVYFILFIMKYNINITFIINSPIN
jgi:hypothetical protein